MTRLVKAMGFVQEIAPMAMIEGGRLILRHPARNEIEPSPIAKRSLGTAFWAQALEGRIGSSPLANCPLPASRDSADS